MKVLKRGIPLFAVLFILKSLIAAQDLDEILQTASSGQPANTKPGNKISLNEIVDLALKNSPELKAIREEIKALDKNLLQQSFSPNPNIDLEVENFLGSGEYSGLDAAEITAMISQEFLPGSKISKRTGIANLESRLAVFKYESSTLAIKAEIKKLVNKIISIDHQYTIQNSLLSNADSLIELTRQLNEQGTASSADLMKASLARKKIKLNIAAYSNIRRSTVMQLARLTGIDNPDRFEFSPNIYNGIYLPDYKEILMLIDNNPGLAGYKTLEEQDDLKIAFQESLSIPDFSIAAGIRRFNPTGDNAFVLGISLPLPVFDSNEGGIAEAIIRKKRNQSDYLANKLRLEQELTALHSNAENLRVLIDQININMVPQAEKVLEELCTGYERGLYTLLEVLDAQKSIIELEIESAEALEEYNNTIFELEKLTGSAFSGNTSEE